MSILTKSEIVDNDSENNQSFILNSKRDEMTRIAMFLRDDWTSTKSFCNAKITLSDGRHEPVHLEVFHTFSTLSIPKSKPYINASDLNKTSVHNIIEWMYLGKTRLNIRNLADHLYAAQKLEVAEFQQSLEKNIIDLCSEINPIYLLNQISKNLYHLPYTSLTYIPMSETCLTTILTSVHEKLNSGLSFRQMIRVSSNSVVTMLMARVRDTMKIDFLNFSLNWIHETHPDDNVVEFIMSHLIFATMTYESIKVLQSTIKECIVPVRRFVQVRMHPNNKIEIRFPGESYVDTVKTYEKDLSTFDTLSVNTAVSGFTLISNDDKRELIRFSHSQNFHDLPLTEDCLTAMTISDTDIRQLNEEGVQIN